MTDNIREKLVEQLREVSDLTPPICEYQEPKEIELLGKKVTVYCKPFEQFQELLREVADYMANGVTVQEWIPVTERLPDIYDKDPNWSQTVLFRTAEGHIHSGYRNIGRPQASFYDDDWTPPYWLDESERLSFEEDEVTHWMPMPAPPKGE